MSEADFFRQPLAEMIDPRHPLAVLASRLPWAQIEAALAPHFARQVREGRAVAQDDLFGASLQVAGAGIAAAGRPRLPIRLMSSLLYLKHAYKLSDEELVERWAENVVWQHFSGMRFYEPRLPCDATQIGRFRSAIGEAGVEELLKATIDTAFASKAIRPAEFERLIVDTTVQEKAIAHPVDSRLLEIARHKVASAAKRAGIALKQTFAREGKSLRRRAGGYAHAKQFKRLRKVVKRQRTILGIVLREVQRKIAQASEPTALTLTNLQTLMERAERIRSQRPKDKNKLYALHAPEVECIGKGKARKPYEFGVKVSVAVTHKQGLMVGARSFTGNPYDGHTLAEQLEQATILTEDNNTYSTTRNILIVWEHGGHLGHLGRLLPVAQVLRSGGARVTFVVPTLPDAIAALDYAGFDRLALPGGVVRSVQCKKNGPVSHAEVLLHGGLADAPHAESVVRSWHALFRRLRPDAVLVDASPLAHYAARCMGLRALVIGNSFELPPQGVKPCFAPWRDGVRPRMQSSADELQATFDRLAITFGGGQDSGVPRSMDELFRADDCLFCIWPELDYFDQPGEAGKTAYLGPIWGEVASAHVDAGWSLSSSLRKRPKVLCYLHVFDRNRFDLVLQSLVQQGADVLVVAPEATEQLREAMRSPNVQVIAQPVALAPLLAQCDAVVCHGGPGIVSRALHAGKPILVLPLYLEHVVLARRLWPRRLAGATVRVRDAAVVGEHVAQLLTNREMQDATRQFASKYAAYRPETTAFAVAQRLVG